jgi:ABC-2 type transport system permease protein
LTVSGFATLFYKEVLRFWKVAFQTVGGPVLSSLLYLVVFSQVLGERVRVFGEVPYTAFLVPGLVMMSLLQNAFANSSSSLIQSKVTGNLVFVLLAPISHVEFFAAYVLASVVRGLVVGAGVLAIGMWFIDLPVAAPLWVLAFGVLGAALAGVLGLLAGLWADKFDQIAAFQSFLVLPLTMLSGVFYSIHSLPPAWQAVSRFNPFFYMIDGFRHGFFDAGDVSPASSLAFVAVSLAVLSALAIRLLAGGYKIRT